MNYKNKTMVVLAGGLGSRYNGLKQVDGILDNGAPLMEYSISDAIEAGFNKIVIIINKMVPTSYLERLETLMKQKNTELEFVYQSLEDHLPENYDLGERQKPWGTSHALLCAKDAVNEPFIVLNADDFYSKEAYKIAADAIDNGEIDEKHFQLCSLFPRTYPERKRNRFPWSMRGRCQRKPANNYRKNRYCQRR